MEKLSQPNCKNPVGRPRVVSPSPEECRELGEDLVAWAMVEDEKTPRTRFAQWYSLHQCILRKDWKTLIQRPEFVPYYEQAQAILAQRCIDGTMEKSFGQRFLRLYERDVTAEENSQKEYDAELKKKVIEFEHQLKAGQMQDFNGELAKLLDYIKEKK